MGVDTACDWRGADRYDPGRDRLGDFGCGLLCAPGGRRPANGSGLCTAGGQRLADPTGDDPSARKITADGRGGCGREPHCHHRLRQHRAGLWSHCRRTATVLQLHRKPLGGPFTARSRWTWRCSPPPSALHFLQCVAGGKARCGRPTRLLIAAACQAGALVSFDPNLRFPLWPGTVRCPVPHRVGVLPGRIF